VTCINGPIKGCIRKEQVYKNISHDHVTKCDEYISQDKLLTCDK